MVENPPLKRPIKRSAIDSRRGLVGSARAGGPCQKMEGNGAGPVLKTISTTPNPRSAKDVPSKDAIKWGVGCRKKSLEITGPSQRIWCTNSDFYGIRTPTFMPFEPRLLCHMSGLYWGWGWSSIYWCLTLPQTFHFCLVIWLPACDQKYSRRLWLSPVPFGKGFPENFDDTLEDSSETWRDRKMPERKATCIEPWVDTALDIVPTVCAGWNFEIAWYNLFDGRLREFLSSPDFPEISGIRRNLGEFGELSGNSGNSGELSGMLTINSVGIPGGFRGNTGFSGKFGVWGRFGWFRGVERLLRKQPLFEFFWSWETATAFLEFFWSEAGPWHL